MEDPNMMNEKSSTMSNVISSDKVEGTTVYNAGGEKLGSIDDLMIDKVSGQVQYAVLEFGGFLGVGSDRYPIPWKVLKYSTDKGGYVVPLDKARLSQAPKYQDDSTPVYDRDYGNRIDRYYDSH
jgi:sporulation protein YlmC with PRC-barrel domain